MMMISGWRRARNALGLHACLSFSSDPDHGSITDRQNVHPSLEEERSSAGPAASEAAAVPTSPRSPSRFHLMRSSIRPSRSTCAICLEAMKPGQGHALFTAECSHTFHFSCIASNVRHGNLVCPVCRANWKEVPWQAPTSRPRDKRSAGVPPQRRNMASGPRQSERNGTLQYSTRDGEEEQRQMDPVLRILDESIANFRGIRQNFSSSEPSLFDDDEPLEGVSPANENQSFECEADVPSGLSGDEEVDVRAAKMEDEGTSDTDRVDDGNGSTESKTKCQGDAWRGLQVTSCAEVRAVSFSEERESFTVLIHVKAPAASKTAHQAGERAPSLPGREDAKEVREQDRFCASIGMLENSAALLDPSCRAPLDLVTVLDVSGSMSGTKLALLKRAMGFVIRNLSPSDRLAVIAFASTAKRVMPLRRMVEEGRQAALQAIDSLVCTGGTNIGEGLRKGAKVLQDRRERNPVASIMLLSDGQNTHTMSSRTQIHDQQHHPQPHRSATDQRRTVPGSVRHGMRYGHVQIPVHAFGFGVAHEATTMHSISEESGGTFSFIQAEGLVQDAFAQCIGGLLSVVVQEAEMVVMIGTEGMELKTIEAGSYESSILDSGRRALVRLGDLYAEEERDVLVELKLPSLQEAGPNDKNSAKMSILRVHCTYKDPASQQMVQTPEHELVLARPEQAAGGGASVEVERQRSRLRIEEARAKAERGAVGGAKQSLERWRGDNRWGSLGAEVREMEERMASLQVSGPSSHLLHPRATTRGRDHHLLLLHHERRGYPDHHRAASMADMVLRSHTSSSSSSSTTIALPNAIASSMEAPPPSQLPQWHHRHLSFSSSSSSASASSSSSLLPPPPPAIRAIHKRRTSSSLSPATPHASSSPPPSPTRRRYLTSLQPAL